MSSFNIHKMILYQFSEFLKKVYVLLSLFYNKMASKSLFSLKYNCIFHLYLGCRL
jgi:hypothetical protein